MFAKVWAIFSTLEMGAIVSLETMVTVYQATRYYIAEDSDLENGINCNINIIREMLAGIRLEICTCRCLSQYICVILYVQLEELCLQPTQWV
jgi:hypothetical protein